MPVVMDRAVDVAEAAAINDVGFAFDKWLQKRAIVRRVVFQIGILNDDRVAGASQEAGFDCAAFSLVLIVKNDLQLWIWRATMAFQVGQKFAGAVGAAVIDDDQLNG